MCDWATIYYDETVKQTRYASLLTDCNDVMIAGVRHRFEPYEWNSSIVLNSDDGWYVKIIDPEWEPTGAVKPHPVEIQARGRAWAGGIDILKALDDWEAFLELDVLPDKRIPGRIDLAADVWIREEEGQPSAGELYRMIIAEGDDEQLSELWATRSRYAEWDTRVDTRFVGRGARTMYLGKRKGIQLAVYNKTEGFEGNTAELVEAEWLKNGWERGNGMVMRLEWRISREAIREQVFPTVDSATGGKDGNKVNFQEVLEALPDIWETCLERFRFAPYDGRTKDTRKRAPAPLWARLLRNPPQLRGSGYGVGLTAVKRGYDVEKLKERAIHSLINIEHALGPYGPGAVLKAAQQTTPENEDYRRRTRWAGFKSRWKHGTTDRREEQKNRGERLLPGEGNQ